MKKYYIIVLLFIHGYTHSQTSTPDYRNSKLSPEIRTQDLLSRMTAEEKFWQCFMLSESWDLDKDRYTSGIFGFEGGESDGIGNAQLIKLKEGETKVNLAGKINAAQHFFVEKTRLGIPMIPYAEALHGLIRDGAVSYPQAIGLAATFDTSLMSRISQAIAEETRNCGIRMILSPVVNIANDPRWGRTEETYGEDPCLSSAMGVAFVKNFEKAGIITCPKHFVANYGDGGRDSYPVHADQRLLNEVFFPPFKACISQGGSQSVMTAYNSLSGIPCTANNMLQYDILKKQWGFRGFVISDAGATGGSNCLHMTAKDYYESTVKAMNNGLDVIFQTNFDHYKLFMPPFLDGSILKEAIDSAVYRVLLAKFRLGLFDDPYVKIDKVASNTERYTELAREAACKSVVLLKNKNHVLPLSKTMRSVAVIGPDAVEARLGGYSGKGFNKVNILEGITNKLVLKETGINNPSTPCRIYYEKGCGRESSDWTCIPEDCLFYEDKGNKIIGLKGEYYNNINMSGNPAITRQDKKIDFRWTLYSPDPAINYDWFSVKWTGKLVSAETGTYQIGVEGNDGYRLYLDDSLIIDNLQKVSFRSILKEYSFIKGKEYNIRLEFHETSGSVWFKLIWDQGIHHTWKEDIAKAVAAAEKSDAVIFVAGIQEGEGLDRAHLSLPGHQEEQILQLAATGKPLIVLLCGGSAITVNSWIDKVPVLLDIWYPGEQGGNAIADILFGDSNPGGRLPVTFPITEGQLPLYYYHKPTGRNDDYADNTGEAQFPFGFGLSYTEFLYSNLIFDKLTVKKGEELTVQFTITNTGNREGNEVPQLYIKDLLASVARPMKELKYFQRVSLKPGQSKLITWKITPEMLSMFDSRLDQIIEPGDFRVLIGSSSKDIRLRETITVTP